MRSKALTALFPPLTADDHRRRVAHHESGHAVVAWSFGRDVEMISIRPAGRLDGWCLHSLGPSISEQLALGGIEAQPAAIRRRAEQEAIIRLAGPAAESMAGPLLTRRGDDPEEVEIHRRLDELAELVPADADLLEREERCIAAEPERGPMGDDAGLAFRQSRAIAGASDEEGIAHYVLMRAVARRLVADRWPAIQALAEVLNRRGVIAGAEAEQIIEAALSKGVQLMPSKAPIVAKPDPNKLYRALWGFRSRDGSRVVRTNALLRGDDPLVAESFDLFLEDAPTKEIERARAASIRATRPAPLADADSVIVIQRVRIDGEWFRPGDRFPKASPVVRRHPDWFKPAGEPSAPLDPIKAD